MITWLDSPASHNRQQVFVSELKIPKNLGFLQTEEAQICGVFSWSSGRTHQWLEVCCEILQLKASSADIQIRSSPSSTLITTDSVDPFNQTSRKHYQDIVGKCCLEDASTKHHKLLIFPRTVLTAANRFAIRTPDQYNYQWAVVSQGSEETKKRSSKNYD